MDKKKKSKEIRRHPEEINENKNTTYQNKWNVKSSSKIEV